MAITDLDLSKVQLLGDRILLRITSEHRESIYTKQIVRDDGSKVTLFKTIKVDEIDEAYNSKFVQTATVEKVNPNEKNIQVGDIAIIDYTVCNSSSNFFCKDGDDDLFLVNANSTYHKETLVVDANRRITKPTIVYYAGDVDELSPILGLIRGGELISNSPYVFLEHEESVIQKVSAFDILYTEEEKTYQRKVISSPIYLNKQIPINKGDILLLDDRDVFPVILNDKKIDCVVDTDVLAIATNTKK